MKKSKRKWNSWFLELSQARKNTIYFVAILVALFAIGAIAVDFYFGTNDEYIKSYECKSMIRYEVANTVGNTWWQVALIEYKPLFAWVLAALGIGWIFHGVGFKVIG